MTTLYEALEASYNAGDQNSVVDGRTKTQANYIRGFDRKDNDITLSGKRDGQGYVFVTKPMCNLLDENTIFNRKLLWLSEPDPNSMAAAVKCSLMPDPNMHDVIDLSNGRVEHVRSAIVDDHQPFIPMLTTSMTSLTGWPDRVTEYLQYDEGIAKEVTFHVDNRPENFGTFDLTATFKTAEGDFVNGWIQSLWEYQASVAVGRLMPFPNLITQRELDYNVRFYRVITDDSRKWVRKIAMCGAAVLGADTSGSDFNMSSETHFTSDNEEISVPFKCVGAIYNDPAIIRAFNNTVLDYNPLMAEDTRADYFVKLNDYEKTRYHEGYPLISDDYELEWWVPINVYNQLLNQI